MYKSEYRKRYLEILATKGLATGISPDGLNLKNSNNGVSSKNSAGNPIDMYSNI